MVGDPSLRPGLFAGLSGRLLMLTALFVMLAEALILLPSMARFRETYLHEQMAKAYLAVLAVEAAPDNQINESVGKLILRHAGAYGVVLKAPHRRTLVLGEDLPHAVDVTFMVGGDKSSIAMIVDAMRTMAQTEDRIMRVIGAAPDEPTADIEVLLNEAPLRQAMRAYAVRVLALSLAISLIAASLVYLSLQILFVRPIRRITDQVRKFRLNPELTIAHGGANFRRKDEIGVLQRAITQMQTDIRLALRQKTRLAALGAAVAKISHDLRNTLSTAVMLSDRLSASDDPETRRLSPRLVRTIDQAASMCVQSLAYLRDEQPALAEQWVSLRQLIEDAVGQSQANRPGQPTLTVVFGDQGHDPTLFADRGQLLRLFRNLVANAEQAGASRLTVREGIVGDHFCIDLEDDGSGMTADVRERLFQPFVVGRRGGTGLGLVIAREIAQSHGGDLTLLATGPTGTTFRLMLPVARLCLSSSVKSARSHDQLG